MKKFVDENGRLFGKISLIDIAVILIVIALAGVLLAKEVLMPVTDKSDGYVDIQYTVTIENMPAGRLNSLQDGDMLYDAGTKLAVGKITQIDFDECEIAIQLADGQYTEAVIVVPDGVDVEERYNVTLTVDAEATKDSRGHYYVNRTVLIGSGWLMNYSTKASLFTGTITELTEIAQ